MSTSLKAHRQWAERPADERFWSLQDMLEATKSQHVKSAEGVTRIGDLKFIGRDGHVLLEGATGKRLIPTHYAFGQAARMMGAPAEYLRKLPAEKVVDLLNYGMGQMDASERDRTAHLLLSPRATGTYQMRAITSEKYSRIWNDYIVETLMPLTQHGWRNPPARPSWGTTKDDPRARPATTDDLMTCSRVQVGEIIAPAGLYASDRDMFIYMVNDQNPLDDGSGVPLYRGFFMWNSEVGNSSFGIEWFWFNETCGNHIIHGMKNGQELRVVHLGEANVKASHGIEVDLAQYADAAISETTHTLKAARRIILGNNQEEVVDTLFNRRALKLGRNILEEAFLSAEQHPEDSGGADPRSIIGMVQGLTRVSQSFNFADKRVEIDRAAGRVLAIANN